MSECSTEERLEAHVRSLEGVIDRAFHELACYREGLEHRLTLPLVHDLVALYHMVVRAQQEPPSEPERFFEVLESEILNALARQDVALMDTPVGQPLDRKLQRAIAVLPSDRPEDDLKVVSLLRPGFTCGTGVVAKAEVMVRRYVPPATEEEE